MSNKTSETKSRFNKNWKWLLLLFSFMLIAIVSILPSNLGNQIVQITQTYGDTELYEHPFEMAQNDKRVIDVLGQLKPIDKLAILEGEVHYSNNYKSVDLSFRIKGGKRNARLDISADRINGKWNYKKVNVRIKKPVEEKQIIEIIEPSK
ncbi:cytochrome c oxidase assembly factor Coa1 family protein [Aquimarina sp. 2201CG1-2-11]|uniref:cytochrome c oxidase assembly factor Coa1 family protein n=1 Tax=Aquimarina discodermiae TaxID=3231043 RepID=UPI0034621171